MVKMFNSDSNLNNFQVLIPGEVKYIILITGPAGRKFCDNFAYSAPPLTGRAGD
jgi:hypothetical protein